MVIRDQSLALARTPEEAVEYFVDALKLGELAAAYALLSTTDRGTVPLREWLEWSWDTEHDELVKTMDYVSIGDAIEFAPSQARVPVAMGFPNDVKFEFTYAAVLEDAYWRVQLGLDRAVQRWSSANV